jgi:ABC-type amino acid transport substrate-binding protein
MLIKSSKYFLIIIFVLSLLSIKAINENKTDTQHNSFNDLHLTAEEIEWLKEHPVIKAGSDPNWAPFEFVDKDGTHKGIVIDYLKIIEQKLGIKFEISDKKSWAENLELAKNKKIDVISGITPSEERTQYFNFTEPYITYRFSIYAKKDVTYIGDLSKLNGQKVAAIKGYLSTEFIKQDYPEIEVIEVNSPREGLNLLKKDKAQAFIGGIVNVGYEMHLHNYKNIRVVGETPYYLAIAMGVRNDWPIFHSIMVKALNSISTEQKR